VTNEAVTIAAVNPRRRLAARRSGFGIVRVLLIPAAVLLLWEALARLGILPEYLVGPVTIAATAFDMIASGELWPHLGASLLRCYGGFALGAALGCAAGLLAGVSPKVRSLFDPLVSLSYPIPKIAVLPILMVWLGLGDASKIAIIALSVFYPLYIGAFQGVLSINPLLVWAARTFGASPMRIYCRVVLPAALPPIFAALRVGLAISFILLFAAEMVSAHKGLGYLIVQAQHFQRFDIMFVAVATIGFFGFVSDRTLMLVQRRLLAYHYASPGA
jgi:ABC-type nitrate/sulfonate/bicarbonate transport system permease component